MIGTVRHSLKMRHKEVQHDDMVQLCDETWYDGAAWCSAVIG